MDPGSLLTLQDKERNTRDQARVALHDCRQVADRAQAQADELQQYRSDYLQRWSTQFRQQGGIELMQCYQGFVLKLDQAIAQQGAAVQHALLRDRIADPAEDIGRSPRARIGPLHPDAGVAHLRRKQGAAGFERRHLAPQRLRLHHLLQEADHRVGMGVDIVPDARLDLTRHQTAPRVRMR